MFPLTWIPSHLMFESYSVIKKIDLLNASGLQQSEAASDILTKNAVGSKQYTLIMK